MRVNLYTLIDNFSSLTRTAPHQVKSEPRDRRARPTRTYSSTTTARTLLGLEELAQRAIRATSGPASVDGVYIISVAARILEMHPQTLRKYERAGLVTPSRTVGMLRLYSEEDIARLRLIKHLVGDLGLNLAGVQLVLNLFNNLLATRGQMDGVDDPQLRAFMTESLDEMFELVHAHIT